MSNVQQEKVPVCGRKASGKQGYSSAGTHRQPWLLLHIELVAQRCHSVCAASPSPHLPCQQLPSRVSTVWTQFALCSYAQLYAAPTYLSCQQLPCRVRLRSQDAHLAAGGQWKGAWQAVQAADSQLCARRATSNLPQGLKLKLVACSRPCTTSNWHS